MAASDMPMPRGRYAAMIIAVAALKLAAVAGTIASPQSIWWLRNVDLAAVIGLAFVVGFRFQDVGWPRWAGIGAVLALMVLLPVLVQLASPKPFAAAADLDWIGAVLLIAVVVWAGWRRGVSDA